MEETKPKGIQFIGEQDGEPERDFKCELSVFLRQLDEWRPLDEPVRAYLCRVTCPSDDNSDSFDVALCFATKSDAKGEILKGAASIFHRMFGRREHLDIMFVDNDTETELRQVCSPFVDTEEVDFVLASGDSRLLENPRNCVVLGRYGGEHPDGYVLVSIDPPLIGQQFGLGGEDVHEVVLMSRWTERTLNPITEWPVFVHVFLPWGNVCAKSGQLGKEDLKSIAWAEIYKKREDIPSGRLPR